MTNRIIFNEFSEYIENFVQQNPLYKYDIEQNNETHSIGIVILFLHHEYRDIFYVFLSTEKLKIYNLLNGTRCEMNNHLLSYYTKDKHMEILKNSFIEWKKRVEQKYNLFLLLKNQIDVFHLENPFTTNVFQIIPNESDGIFEISYILKKNEESMKIFFSSSTSSYIIRRNFQNDLIFHDPIVIQDQLIDL